MTKYSVLLSTDNKIGLDGPLIVPRRRAAIRQVTDRGQWRGGREAHPRDNFDRN